MKRHPLSVSIAWAFATPFPTAPVRRAAASPGAHGYVRPGDLQPVFVPIKVRFRGAGQDDCFDFSTFLHGVGVPA